MYIVKYYFTINFNKTEFIAINTDLEFHINIEENVTINQVQNFKYLGVYINKNPSTNFKCGLGLERGPPSLVRTIG